MGGRATKSKRWWVIAILLAGCAAGGWQAWNLMRGTPRSATAAQPPAAAPATPTRITAIGRLEPQDGVITIAGPSQPAVVISELRVDDGDPVQTGQIIAVLDSHPSLAATVERLQAELAFVDREFERQEQLYREGVSHTSLHDEWKSKHDVLHAEIRRAEADRDLAVVRSPIDGQVIEVHARAGERVGPKGIVELGKTQQMYAIAEVYETDVRRVRPGQRAMVTSPALARPVEGTVDYVGMKVCKNDVLQVDPAARTDARVVEVKIRLDDSDAVASMTNLQVDVAIAP